MLTLASLRKFLIQGLEKFRLFYSFYDAEITSNDDPEKRRRIKVN